MGTGKYSNQPFTSNGVSWEFRNFGIWEFGNMGIFEFGNLGIFIPNKLVGEKFIRKQLAEKVGTVP